ncbi:MAG: B12-binding domain-containing radical SAM protein, partial [Promethearchaeota archaeon]
MVQIVDYILNDGNLNSIRDKILQFKPDYVGISCCYTYQIEYTLKIAKIAKNLGSKTVLGGWHPTLVPEETLKTSSVDIIVRGEGEITFRELIKNDSPVGIKGLSYKEDGKLIHNEDRELMDLTNARIVNRSLRYSDGKKFYNFFGFPIDCMEVSRGCPFSCEFCCIHNFYRHKYRKRSIKSVIKELKIMESQYNCSDFIYIVDDNFVVDYKFVMDLCDAIIDNGIKKYFFSQARVDMIVKHPEVFEKMAQAGFVLLFIGLESFSDQTLETINKQIKYQEIKNAIKILHNFGYIIQGSVI